MLSRRPNAGATISPGIVPPYPSPPRFPQSQPPTPPSAAVRGEFARPAAPGPAPASVPPGPSAPVVLSPSVEAKSGAAPNCSAAYRKSRLCTAGASVASRVTSKASPSPAARPPPLTARPGNKNCGPSRAISPCHQASSSRASSAICAKCSRSRGFQPSSSGSSSCRMRFRVKLK